MKKIIPVICCVFFFSHANAQDQNCNDAVIMNVKGKWTTSADDIVSPDKTFPAKQYNQLKTRIDKIAEMFQQAYPQPIGAEAKWFRSIRGNALINNGPVPYRFNSLYLLWYCNPNLHKAMVGDETGTWAYVYVNDFGWFMGDQYDKATIKIEDNTAYMLPKLVGQWKGLLLYEPRGNTKDNEHRAVLITRNNQLPYKPVSRLQYLQAMKQKLENEKKIQIDIINKLPVKTDAGEEEAKQQGLENVAKNNRADKVEQRKADYLKNYKTDKQRKEENLQRTGKNFDDQVKAIEDIGEKYNKDELQQPAIIDEDHGFKEFITQEKGGRMIVLINTAYFNMQLPRYAPQFMVLYWRSQNKVSSQDFKKQLEGNFPVDKLKAMIDK